MSYEIQKIGADEVEAVHDILRECGQDMKLRLGLGHWDPPYPLHLMRREAEEGKVHAVCDGERTVATFTIGTEAYPYHDMTLWTDPTAKATYVGHLAVLPHLQGKGIGTWCMRIIEDLAIDQGSEAIRLDAYGTHAKLLEFYARLGYSQRGVVRFRGADLVCFEKVIER
jgi:GNAT superfamily N-acetyltransferase